MSLLSSAIPEFLGSIAATVAVAAVRWSVNAARARASRTRQAEIIQESGPTGS